jgi:hypothetical protein
MVHILLMGLGLFYILLETVLPCPSAPQQQQTHSVQARNARTAHTTLVPSATLRLFSPFNIHLHVTHSGCISPNPMENNNAAAAAPADRHDFRLLCSIISWQRHGNMAATNNGKMCAVTCSTLVWIAVGLPDKC